MNYKLLKLNIKVSLMKFFTNSKTQGEVNNFTAEKIRNPEILVIFPAEDNLIEETMDCMSKVVSAHARNDPKFSFVIGKGSTSKVNFFNIWTKSFNINVIPIDIKKDKYIIMENGDYLVSENETGFTSVMLEDSDAYYSFFVIQEEYDLAKQAPQSDNEFLDTEAASILDFTEVNPFGEPSDDA